MPAAALDALGAAAGAVAAIASRAFRASTIARVAPGSRLGAQAALRPRVERSGQQVGALDDAPAVFDAPAEADQPVALELRAHCARSLEAQRANAQVLLRDVAHVTLHGEASCAQLRRLRERRAARGRGIDPRRHDAAVGGAQTADAQRLA